MEANSKQRECLLCHKLFAPDPRVKNQYVCSDDACQRLRQKLNHLAWQKNNPDYYEQFYQDYYKPWLEKNPDYQRQYRQRKKDNQAKQQKKIAAARKILEPLLAAYLAEKKNRSKSSTIEVSAQTDVDEKEESTSLITNSFSSNSHDKKEELTYCICLIRAKELDFIPIHLSKIKHDNFINKLSLCT